MLTDMVEWLMRVPSRTPRRVHLSRELDRRVLSPTEIAGIRRVGHALSMGYPVNMFLGKATATLRQRPRTGKKPHQFTDLVFADWGLLHFHLGPDIEQKGRRVARSRRVLIAYLDVQDAYFLDLAAHGRDDSPSVWGEKRFLEILCREWPHVMERFELRSCLPAEPGSAFSASDFVRLRQAGVTTTFEVQGKVYMGPGMGVSTDTSSTRAVMLADQIMTDLRHAERVFREQYPDDRASLFVAKDASVGFYLPDRDCACSVLPAHTSQARVTWFFQRLLEETRWLAAQPAGTIWHAPTTLA